jgi:cellobiose transport system substrate-binding protein
VKRIHAGRRWQVIAVIGALVAAVAVGLVATTASARSRDDVTLNVSLFGDFGYHDLYKQYEAAHPGVTIKESIQDYGTHHTQLAQHIATGAGAADVEAIEVGFIPQFTAQAQNFVDLRKYGADTMKSRYLPWKYQQAVGKGGAVVGLGTDVGSLAICYRKDLFAKAGLPTNRVAVSKLWPSWQAYINTGKRYQAKAPKGTYFFDSGSNVYNAMVGQLNPAYYNAAGKVIVATNPLVKAAYNLTISGWQAGEDAGLAAFSTNWNTGYKKGLFATVTCPAWMMGYIQGQAPKSKGKWDIAATPGTGGNWGGSFLAIPKQSSHPDEAADLIKFLTSPASEAYIFKQTGNLPSQTALLKSAPVQNFKNPFFSNAPVGQIFANSALRLKPQILGPHQGDIQNAASAAFQRVEQKKSSPAKSWAQFLKDVKNVAG